MLLPHFLFNLPFLRDLHDFTHSSFDRLRAASFPRVIPSFLRLNRVHPIKIFPQYSRIQIFTDHKLSHYFPIRRQKNHRFSQYLLRFSPESHKMAQESCNLDKEEAEVLKPPSSPPHTTPPSSSSSSSPPPLFLNQPKLIPSEKLEPLPSKLLDESQPSIRPINRCSCCCKKVGLAGFRCRCGELFCSRHRYSETHDCSFDYKSVGREEISKANPLVRASKIIKI